MALQPDIALGVQTPPLQPLNVAQQFGQAAAGIDQMAQARQRMMGFQLQAQINQAVQAAGGDYDQAADDLQKQGHAAAGQQLLGWLQDYREKAGKMQETNIKNHQAMVDMLGQATQGLLMNPTPENAAAMRQMLMGMSGSDPAAQQMIDAQLPEGLTDTEDIRKRAQALSATGTAAKDFWDSQMKSAQFYQGKDFRASLAQSLANSDNPAQIIAGYKAQPLFPRAVVNDAEAMLAGLPADPAARKQAILDWGKTPYEQGENQAQMAQAVARQAQAAASGSRADTAAQAAEALDRYHQGLLSIDKSRLSFQMGQGFGGDGTQPSPALMGALDQLKAGTLKYSELPPMLKMPVLSYSYQNGLDPSWTMPLSAQVLARDQFAAQVAPQVDKVRAMAKQIDDAGLMGSFAGRWRDLTSKESSAASVLGALTKGYTPEQQRLIGNFVTQADLLSTGTAMSHFGARASGAAVQNMRENLDPKGKDLPSYLGSLDATQQTLLGYATEMPGYSAAHPDAVQKLKDWDAAHGITTSTSGATGSTGGGNTSAVTPQQKTLPNGHVLEQILGTDGKPTGQWKVIK